MSSKSLQPVEMSLPISGSVDSYIQMVNRIPLLTVEEERELANRFYQQGDLEAARKLVMAHLRFVVRVAQGYMGYGLPLADLIQEGNVGLMKAVKRFDPDVGVRLVSFAVHWVKAEIHEFVIRNWRIVKVATTKAQRKLFFNLRNNKKRLGWFTNEEVDALAADLNVSRKDVLEMEARMNAHDAAYDGYESDNDDGIVAPAYYLEDKSSNTSQLIEYDDSHDQNMGQLYDAMDDLDDRSKDILQARWLSDEKQTLQDLAEKYQVSPERIRQIEKSAFKKLKDAMVEVA